MSYFSIANAEQMFQQLRAVVVLPEDNAAGQDVSD